MRNKVELLGIYGDDLTHALSAWTSTSRDLSDEKRKRAGKLLHMLATNGHMTPFEKSSLHFLVTMDIASHIHLIKHRISVPVNSESARYKEFIEDKYFIPDDWNTDEQKRLEQHILKSYEEYHSCIKRLEEQGIPRKRAKESARFYLPYGIQITCDVMFNWRSFAHFQGLRNKPDAQKEIRDIAQNMLELVEETGKFPETIAAMKAAGFISK